MGHKLLVREAHLHRYAEVLLVACSVVLSDGVVAVGEASGSGMPFELIRFLAGAGRRHGKPVPPEIKWRYRELGVVQE
jgi:hypothetical protein